MSPLLRPEDIEAREKALFVPDPDEVRAKYWKVFTDHELAKVIAEKLIEAYRYAYSLKKGDIPGSAIAVDSTTSRDPRYKGVSLSLMQSLVNDDTTKRKLEQAIVQQLVLISEEPQSLFTVRCDKWVDDASQSYITISMLISS